MKPGITIAFLLIIGCLTAPVVYGQAAGEAAAEQSLQAYVDMMRQDIRKEKHTVVDKAMDLDASGKAKFWAVYKGYEKEMAVLWDERIANIEKYAEHYEEVSDAVADELVAKALDIETRRTLVKKKYYSHMKAALGAVAAARFLQLENILNQLIDLQIGSQLPLIQ